MAGAPSEAFIGVAAIGVGTLILYGAVKNVSVFGPDGLITQVVKTGHFPDLNTLKPLFPSLLPSGGVGGMVSALQLYTGEIAVKDPALAAEINAAFAAWNPTTDPNGSDALNNALAKAAAAGYTTQANGIRDYMMTITGQKESTPSSTDSTPKTVTV